MQHVRCSLFSSNALLFLLISYDKMYRRHCANPQHSATMAEHGGWNEIKRYILRSTTHARLRWFSQRPELRSHHCCSRVGKTITTLNFMLMSTSRQIALRRKNMTMIATRRIDNHQMSSMWCHHRRFHDFNVLEESCKRSSYLYENFYYFWTSLVVVLLATGRIT